MISTVVGNGAEFYNGDGGPALNGRFGPPTGVAVALNGDIYICDSDYHRIRKVDRTTGIIQTMAGTGEPGFAGDGGAATDAQLNYPMGVAVDAEGNIYIADTGNNRVRKVEFATGRIVTLAGNGDYGYGGDGGLAVDAQLLSPNSVAIGAAGEVYIADTGNFRVRRVGQEDGVISTIAGDGGGVLAGDGGPAVDAQLGTIWRIAVDSVGNIYLTDGGGGNRVRKIDFPSGIIRTVVGTGEAGYSGDGGVATSATIDYPVGVAVDSVGNIYVADAGNQRIRKVNGATGIITTIAGTAISGFSGDGGLATNARITMPMGVAVDSAGRVYFADYDAWRIRMVVPLDPNTPDTIAPAAVSGLSARPGIDSGTAKLSWVNTGDDGVSGNISGGTFYVGYSQDPAHVFSKETCQISVGTSVAAGAESTYMLEGLAPESTYYLKVYLADAAGNVLEASSPAQVFVSNIGLITTIAGNGESGDVNVPFGALATDVPISPFSVSVDTAGNVLVSDSIPWVLRVGKNGQVSRMAGTGEAGYGGDGEGALEARFGDIYDVVSGPDGSVYIVDAGNQRVRKVDPAGTITTLAGTGEAGYSGDGGPAETAQLNNPSGLALDSSGNIYISELSNHCVRKVDASGTITTVAGTGEEGYSGDGGPAVAARLLNPAGVAADTLGNLYITDNNGHRVRKVEPSGIITTVAGTGESGDSGDGGPAVAARLSAPSGIFVDAAGNVYVADTGNHRVRVINTQGVIYTVAGEGAEGGYVGDGMPAVVSRLMYPYDVSGSTDGKIYIADSNNNRVRMVRVGELAPDIIPPETSFHIQGASYSVGGVVYAGAGAQFRLSAADVLSGAAVSGLEESVYSIDGAAFTPYSGLFQLAGEGLHGVGYYSRDKAGNSEVERSTSVYVDLSGPEAVNTLQVASRDADSIALAWNSANDSGRVGRYLVSFSTSQAELSAAAGIPVPAGEVYSSTTVYTAVLEGLAPGVVYYAGVWAEDVVGNISGISNVVSTNTYGGGASEDSVAEIIVPDGVSISVAEVSTVSVTSTMTVFTAMEASGLEPVQGAFYEFEPSGVQFAEPATLRFAFDPVGVDTTTLAIYYFDGVAWSSAAVLNQRVVLEPSLAYLEGEITHTSMYALLRKKAVSGPVVTVVFSPSTLNLGSNGQYVTAELAFSACTGCFRTETVNISAINGQLLAEPVYALRQGFGRKKSGYEVSCGTATVKFSREALEKLLPANAVSALTVAGLLDDGKAFSAEASIRTVKSFRGGRGNKWRFAHRCGAFLEGRAKSLREDLDLFVLKVEGDLASNERARERAAAAAGLKRQGGVYEFGPEGLKFEEPVTISLPYDASEKNPERLAVAYWNQGKSAWERLPSVVDRAGRFIKADVEHFSQYQVVEATVAVSATAPVSIFRIRDEEMAAAASVQEFRLGEVYVYPDPAKGGKVPVFHIEVGTADTVKIRVYTVAGQVAHEASLTGAPQAVGSLYAYEYAWNGRIASGVYYYTVEAERSGKKLRSKGKFSVIR